MTNKNIQTNKIGLLNGPEMEANLQTKRNKKEILNVKVLDLGI